MKLVRFEDGGGPELGVLTQNGVISLAPLASRYPTMLAIAAGGADALREIQAYLDDGMDVEPRPIAITSFLPPIERPGKFLAIGLNYASHRDEAARAGYAAPNYQLWFNKQTSCIAGPYDDIDPGVSTRLDYEVELGVVIGSAAKGVTASSARDHVFGYTVMNDFTARDWQVHSPTFTISKSFDTYGPIGPCIVTADEISEPHALGLRCYVNGELRQAGDTSQLIYDLWQQIAYLSAAFTLEPGDLIATGTPDGIGAAMDPPVFLQIGDVVRCEIDQIGAIENRVWRT